METEFLRFLHLFIFYLHIFTSKKILRCDNTADNMVFKVFFIISFLPSVSTTLASLPPGVMLLNRSTPPKESATNIKKVFQQEQE